jgi:hypothetical protein
MPQAIERAAPLYRSASGLAAVVARICRDGTLDSERCLGGRFRSSSGQRQSGYEYPSQDAPTYLSRLPGAVAFPTQADRIHRNLQHILVWQDCERWAERGNHSISSEVFTTSGWWGGQSTSQRRSSRRHGATTVMKQLALEGLRHGLMRVPLVRQVMNRRGPAS